MSTTPVRKLFIAAALFLATILTIRYLGPVLMPFFLGGLIAIGAEPAVTLGVRKLHLPRPLSSALGVTATLILLFATLWLIGALTVKELGSTHYGSDEIVYLGFNPKKVNVFESESEKLIKYCV